MHTSRPFVAAGLSAIVLAASGCAGLGGPALEPSSRQFFDYASLLMTAEEENVFLHLPDPASREEFIRNFWASRDPDPETEENEFREEFFRRVAFADRNFQEGRPGWRTDRGWIYICLGPPRSVEADSMPGSGETSSQLLWFYDHNLTLAFVDRWGDGQFSLNLGPEGWRALRSALELAKLVAAGQASLEKYLDFGFRLLDASNEAVVSIPVRLVVFKAGEGRLSAECEVECRYLGRRTRRPEHFRASARFEKTEEEVRRLRSVDFTLELPEPPGPGRVDVTVTLHPGGMKARKVLF